MAEVLLFHHVQGLTEGVRAFADELRAGGHTVHTPDLFDGERPSTIQEGVAYTEKIDGEALSRQIDRLVADLPEGLVYGGFSWGVMLAQRLAQTRPGARGALLYEACLPITGEWALIVGGLLSIVFGLLLSFYPVSGALAVGFIVGIYALIFGVLFIILAIRLRGHSARLAAV